MMHKKVRKPFPEGKQTKDMNSWNQDLWSDENKINLSGSDGVKHVWRQPGASKYLNVNEICSFNDITIKGEIYSQKSINYSANLTWTTRKETQTSLGKRWRFLSRILSQGRKYSLRDWIAVFRYKVSDAHGNGWQRPFQRWPTPLEMWMG